MIASAASQKRRPVALRVLVDSSLAPSGATIVVDSPASDPDSDSVHHLLSAEALFLPLPMPADKPRARALGLRISVADNRPAAAVLESPSSSPSTILSADTFPSPSPSSAELAPAAPTPAASRRNRKGLSLSVHPQPSSGSLRSLASSSASTTHSRPPPSSLPASPASTHAAAPSIPLIAPVPHPPRRASVTSLPPSRVVHRAVEDAAPGTPYADGPVEILPGIWLGTEENARDWDALKDRGIGYVLNVAKEVLPPFFPSATQPVIFGIPMHLPADEPSGQPELCYLHLPWSHGQSDLVQLGFPAAMDFVDRAREAGSGVLIHCQCGVSRSATLVIAIVMRAARLPNAGADMKDVRDGGMHAAYAFTKQRSRWISPNMSYIDLPAPRI
ncbi:hypothetical protein BOTBODRAFT_60332 [Botryobasidium botryosum FD-172 SS1]|uniref:protein-tyrosine-phosphatase n=1 Tax=Botryobasidium botryosum (strain FD-172 SS1) TaxID=930990 RepID=A0A067LX77_BOTB1|nr:hypothetical protein BOTBODRAFT_60332 [Botryobasidium botryosum FD-172 SS1]